jgi:putative transposase
MTCSIDLRERVVNYIRSGGSKAEASRRFSVSRQTVYNWLSRDNLSPKKHGSRNRKLDKQALRLHVQEHPDALLRERAAIFGVTVQALSHALAKMGIGKKKSANIWSETL